MTRLNKMAAAPEIRKERKAPHNYQLTALIIVVAITILGIIIYKRKHK